MTAFSFRRRFVEPIRMGTKRQTVRALRADGRVAKAGTELQLYTGMRTRQCELIGRAVCTGCLPVQLWLGNAWPQVLVGHDPGEAHDPDAFARADGFASWAELVAFWDKEHPGIHHFAGTLTTWGDLL